MTHAVNVRRIRNRVIAYGIKRLCLATSRSRSNCAKRVKKIVAVDYPSNPWGYNNYKSVADQYYRSLGNHVYAPAFSRVELICKSAARFKRSFTPTSKRLYLRCTLQYLTGTKFLYKNIQGTNITLAHHLNALKYGIFNRVCGGMCCHGGRANRFRVWSPGMN